MPIVIDKFLKIFDEIKAERLDLKKNKMSRRVDKHEGGVVGSRRV